MKKSAAHHCSTSKSAVLVINYVGVFALCGILGTIGLIYYNANEAAIAILSGMTGVAIGSLASMLNQTQDAGSQSAPGTPENPAVVETGVKPLSTTTDETKP